VFEAAWAVAIALALQSAAAAPVREPAQASPVVATPWTDARPFTRLFPNLVRDLRSLPSSGSAMVLSAGGAGAAAVYSSDMRLANWSARSGDAAYTRAGKMLGDGWIQAGGAVAAYAIGKIARKPQIVHIGGDLIRAQALNGLVTAGIKVGVGRTRPSGGNLSFPSGHTSASFASAATLHAHYGWKVGAPAFATAGFVAWTRARDRSHWLSDIAFGSAIGIATGRAVATKHQPRRVAVVPTLTTGGAALTFFVLPR
jgi:membrane-associated phospholipid phosphatase